MIWHLNQTLYPWFGYFIKKCGNDQIRASRSFYQNKKRACEMLCLGKVNKTKYKL